MIAKETHLVSTSWKLDGADVDKSARVGEKEAACPLRLTAQGAVFKCRADAPNKEEHGETARASLLRIKSVTNAHSNLHTDEECREVRALPLQYESNQRLQEHTSSIERAMSSSCSSCETIMISMKTCGKPNYILEVQA